MTSKHDTSCDHAIAFVGVRIDDGIYAQALLAVSIIGIDALPQTDDRAADTVTGSGRAIPVSLD